MTETQTLADRTPIDIDTELAKLHAIAQRGEHWCRYYTDRVLDMAGMRKEERPRSWGAKTTVTVTGTYAEACALIERWIAAYDAERGVRYEDLSADARAAIGSANGYFVKYRDEREQHRATAAEARARISELNGEFHRRGGWTRKFLVTSSAGHLHSSMECQTCRPTTTYGWWPQLSGMTEAEAIESLGKHADALCSVCFPTAPVAAKRTNITKAQAAKLATTE